MKVNALMADSDDKKANSYNEFNRAVKKITRYKNLVIIGDYNEE